MNSSEPVGKEFPLDVALALATDAGRGYVRCVDAEFMAAAEAQIGREPTSEELWEAVRHHLLVGALELRSESLRRGATEAEADAVRDAFFEGAHAAMLCFTWTH